MSGPPNPLSSSSSSSSRLRNEIFGRSDQLEFLHDISQPYLASFINIYERLPLEDT